MNKKIAFLTTIFPMKEEFLYDFFDSLKKQTYKSLDIIVVNDGFKKFDNIKNFYKELNITELKYQNTIAKNREFGINWCIKNGYDILIFGDSDDYFEKNRIEISLKLLKKYDIVVNDVTLFNENGIIIKKYFSKRLSDYFEFDYNFLRDKNICGFSNSTVNLKIVDEVKFDKDLKIVDWYFYKNLLTKTKAVFTNETVTYYRQYTNNLLGLKEYKKFKFWHEKD